jgi:hypothetical protein
MMQIMNQDKLKLIVKNLKFVVESLESEIYPNVDSSKQQLQISNHLLDYDEIFEDDEESN